MAEALKILGQVAPTAANTATTLYTVPASTQAVVPSIVACNVTGSSVTVRVFAYVSGGSAGVGTAIAYDVVIPARGSEPLRLGVALAAGSVLAVAAGTANAVTFTAFGQEIS